MYVKSLSIFIVVYETRKVISLTPTTVTPVHVFLLQIKKLKLTMTPEEKEREEEEEACRDLFGKMIEPRMKSQVRN